MVEKHSSKECNCKKYYSIEVNLWIMQGFEYHSNFLTCICKIFFSFALFIPKNSLWYFAPALLFKVFNTEFMAKLMLNERYYTCKHYTVRICDLKSAAEILTIKTRTWKVGDNWMIRTKTKGLAYGSKSLICTISFRYLNLLVFGRTDLCSVFFSRYFTTLAKVNRKTGHRKRSCPSTNTEK